MLTTLLTARADAVPTPLADAPADALADAPADAPADALPDNHANTLADDFADALAGALPLPSPLPIQIVRNLESFELRRPPSERSAHHLQIDGVAISERFRPSPHDGLLRGAARESNWAKCPSLEIKSYLDLVMLKSAYDEGHLLLAKELDVFAIGANREANYGLIITAASGTAKKGETAEPMADAINLHVGIWNSDSRFYDARGPMTTVQSDGAAVMRRALHLALTKHTIDATSKVGVALGGGGLLLFNYLCGGTPSRPTVAGCDDNHVGKRLRMALKALRAATQIADFLFGRELLRGLLSEIGFSDAEIAEAFAEGTEDAQNVTAMVKFLRMMAKFTQKQVTDFPVARQRVITFRQQFKALVVLGEYCRNFVELITGLDAFVNTRLPLSALLRRASCLAHLAFVLFRRHGTKFVPSQHYGNTQAMIKAKFVSVACCQAEGIDFYFAYFDATQRLEELFGMQRVMECGSSMDVVQFEERGGDLMESGHIYSDRPEGLRACEHAERDGIISLCSRWQRRPDDSYSQHTRRERPTAFSRRGG